MDPNPYTSPTGASAPSHPTRTVRRVKRIAPLQLGLMLALLYFGLALLFMPILFVVTLAGNNGGRAGAAIGGVMLIMLPIIYGVVGFIGGVIGAFVYNICAGIVGGIEVEVE